MGARAKAETLLHEFGGAFKAISYTLHPSDIDGEAAGKSSNLSWAVRQAWFSIAEDANLEVGNMVITVLDADSRLHFAGFRLTGSRSCRRLLCRCQLQIRGPLS